MNQTIKTIAVIWLMLFGGFSAKSEDILSWQVDESTLVDGIAISTWLTASPYSINSEDEWFAARVKISEGSSSRILDILGKDENGNSELWEGVFGIELADSGSGRWGAEWTQSPTGHKTWHSTTDDPSSPIDDLAALDVWFVMELGYNSWSDGANDYVWQTIAASDQELYSELRSNHMYGQGTIGPATYTPWHPNLFTSPNVPEPDSFVLVLLGFGLLMLLRKSERKEDK